MGAACDDALCNAGLAMIAATAALGWLLSAIL